jgi:subtilisin family serine protease
MPPPDYDDQPDRPRPPEESPEESREVQRRDKARAQIEIILEALGRDNVGWYSGPSDDPADFRYLYRRGHVLVRDEHVGLVLEVLGGGQPVSPQQEERRTGVTLLALPGDRDVPETLDELDRRLDEGIATPDHVLYVTGNAGCCPATEPEEPPADDPVPARSSDESDGKGVRVSVVDTGWYEPAETHPKTPWLRGVTGDPETVNPKAIHPYAGHGTFCAGVVRCVAPACEVRVEGFLPRGGAIFESAIFRQLFEALATEPDVISLSAGTRSRNNLHLLSFERLWERYVQPFGTTVLVAAAGNDGTSKPFWPAALSWTIGVGSLDADGSVSDYSNFGSWVDVFALGRDAVNAFPSGSFTCHEPPDTGEVRTFDGVAQWSGTSFSTPLVAGIIAARMSHTGESARQAADVLVTRARAARQPGEVAVMKPGQHNNS